MVVELTDADEGKPVVHGEQTIGRVAAVRHGTAYVDPDPAIADRIKTRLGWGAGAEDVGAYPLEPHMIAHVHEDRIRLRDDPRDR